jgi:hypothetical protein
MAIVYSDDPTWYPSVQDRCLLCSGDFSDGEPVVMWHGPYRVWLHGGCAGSFVLRIARDAWEVESKAEDGEFTLTFRRGPSPA